MKINDALTLARTIAGDRCKVAWHIVDCSNRAVRITSCYPETAAEVGSEIADAINAAGGSALLRVDAQFVAVWVSRPTDHGSRCSDLAEIG